MSGQATLSFGGDTILLQPAELDRLLRSLRQIQSPAAASMAEEISARTLTGHSELCPTEAELEALVSALARLR
jgi:coproporphyrinogen III oxidase-like Fe-S oxidoreductase